MKKIITVGEVLSLLHKDQIIQMFVCPKDKNRAFTKAYNNKQEIPKRLYKLKVNYLAAGPKSSIWLPGTIKSVDETTQAIILIDAWYELPKE